MERDDILALIQNDPEAIVTIIQRLEELVKDGAKFCTTKTARPISESIRLIMMAGLRLMNPISRNLTLIQSLQ